MFRIDKKSVEFDHSTLANVVIRPAEKMPAASAIEKKKAQQEEETEPIKERTPEEVAEQLLADAKAKADTILSAAKSDAAVQKEQAYQQGYAQGGKQAQKELEQLQIEQQDIFDNTLDDIEQFKEHLLSELEDHTLTLSLDIAKKIIQTELSENNQLYIDMVKKAAQQVRSDEKFTIKVNLKQLESSFPDQGKALSQELSRPLEVVEDPSVPPYGVVIEAEKGIIDAGVDTQLRMIADALDHEVSGNEL